MRPEAGFHITEPLFEFAVGASDRGFRFDRQMPGQIGDIDVRLDISHTNNSDLTAVLTSPAGTSVTLFTGGDVSGQDFSATVFDDQGLSTIGSGSAPYTGRFQPSGLLSAFNGEDPTGDWKLEVTDGGIGAEGSLEAWSVRITLADPTNATVNSTEVRPSSRPRLVRLLDRSGRGGQGVGRS